MIQLIFLGPSRKSPLSKPDGLIHCEDAMLWLLLHAPGAILDIPAAQLPDKSKADSLARTIVCIQTVWFCLQCVPCLAQGLVVNLLRLDVFAH